MGHCKEMGRDSDETKLEFLLQEDAVGWNKCWGFRLDKYTMKTRCPEGCDMVPQAYDPVGPDPKF